MKLIKAAKMNKTKAKKKVYSKTKQRNKNLGETGVRNKVEKK